MTPDISTRFAALSPRPENASIAGSRSAPAENSPGPGLFCPAPPDGGPPSFLDSKLSDPMTPDPTHVGGPSSARLSRNPRTFMTTHDNAARISNQKITLPLAAHSQKTN